MNNLELTPQTIVNGQYVVQDKIGEGNFGKIYEIVTRENRYDTLVLKVQNCTFDTRSYRRELDVLRRCRGSQGFPFLMDAFSETTGGQVYKFLVMTPEGELYLDALRRKDFKLTSANVLRIGWMIFRALTTLHQHGLVHHDIHYGNVLVKRDWAGDVVITLIDFGRSTPESSPNNRLHQVRFQTTLSYAMGNPYSRFDDLMAMGYLLGPSVGVHPFVSEEQTTVQTKEDFHADPTSYFPDDNTQWIPALIKLFERQREEGYNYSAISRVFHDAIPNIEPESFVEYKVTNGDLYID